jgi:hypothetical protein
LKIYGPLLNYFGASIFGWIGRRLKRDHSDRFRIVHKSQVYFLQVHTKLASRIIKSSSTLSINFIKLLLVYLYTTSNSELRKQICVKLSRTVFLRLMVQIIYFKRTQQKLVRMTFCILKPSSLRYSS